MDEDESFSLTTVVTKLRRKKANLMSGIYGELELSNIALS